MVSTVEACIHMVSMYIWPPITGMVDMVELDEGVVSSVVSRVAILAAALVLLVVELV